MKMKAGIETRTGSTATCPHMRSTMLDRPISGNTPSIQPIMPKISAMPPITKATGIAAEDHHEHGGEHDEREIVDEPVDHGYSDLELGMADLDVGLLRGTPANR